MLVYIILHDLELINYYKLPSKCYSTDFCHICLKLDRSHLI